MWVSTISASAASARAASVAWASTAPGAMSARARARARRSVVRDIGRLRLGNWTAWAFGTVSVARARACGAIASRHPAAARVDGDREVAAQPVAQRRGLAHAQAHEVGAQAGAQHAAVVESERTRAVHGGAAQGFGRGQPEARAGQLHGLAQR